MQGQYKYSQFSVVFLAAFCSVVIVLSPSETPGSQQPFLSNTITIEAASRGYPWINLTDGRAISEGVRADAGGWRRRPVSMATGDFNKDGIPDLVVGYGTAMGGSIVLYWGNPDSIYPNSPDAQKRKAAGTFTEAPFLPSGLVHEIPVAPDFMEARDLDGDGNCDLLVTAQGSNLLSVFHGDGNGNFTKTTRTKLPGAVTTLAVEEFGRGGGYPEIAVGVRGAEGPSILIFDWPEEGDLKEFEEIPASEEVRQLIFARIDGSPGSSLLAAAGHELMLIHGVIRLKPPRKTPLKGMAQMEGALDLLPAGTQAGGLKGIKAFSPTESERMVDRYPMPFLIASIALGNFIWDRENLKQIAFISTGGEVHIYESPTEKGMGAALRSTRSKASKDLLSSDFRLVRTKVSSLPVDDLLVLDRSGNQFEILHGDMSVLQARFQNKLPDPFSSISFDAKGVPVAVLPMRLNADPLSDLVILLSESAEGPTVMLTSPSNTAVVTSASSEELCESESTEGLCRTQSGVDPHGNPICGGPCTFLAALTLLIKFPGSSLVQFNIPGPGPRSIEGMELPVPFAWQEAITIDGTSQPGYTGAPVIEIRNWELWVLLNQVTIRGLIFRGTGMDGIRLGTNGNIIEGNYIGTNAAGDAVSPEPFVGNGVLIERSSNNMIGGDTEAARNVIGGNGGFQVQVAYANNNTVQGNYIGTNSKGDAALKKDGKDCVAITNVSQGNKIINNVISGCLNGVSIMDSHDNTVNLNRIGTNTNGDAVIGNRNAGVYILNGYGNEIGRSGDYPSNVISGNTAGVTIESTGNETRENIIAGNFIGTNKTGTGPLGNGLGVALLTDQVKTILITGNLISATGQGSFVHPKGPHGIYIHSSSGNVIAVNLIGLDLYGQKVLSDIHPLNGIKIIDSSNNIVGYWEGLESYGNLISGNDIGINLESENAAVKNNLIASNIIGTDRTGKVFLGNEDKGILIHGLQATNNVIAKNLISGSGHGGITSSSRDGILIRYGSNNEVFGNVIGTNKEGTEKLGNKDAGVRIEDGSENKIGVKERNTITGNDYGVVIQSKKGPAKKNQINGNQIGINRFLGIELGHGRDGILIEGKDASENEIIKNDIFNSGTAKDPAHAHGIHISQGSQTVVKDNRISRGNSGVGIKIWNGSNNIIGGLTDKERNGIGLSGLGVMIEGTEDGKAEWNLVVGNYIGSDPEGTLDGGNKNQGVFIRGWSATNNTIRGNMIGRNGHTEGGTIGLGVGVHLEKCQFNKIVGNAIGTDFNEVPSKYVGNKDHGIMIVNAEYNTIGGLNEGDSNRIAFNGRAGIFVESGGSNEILSNAIFSNDGLGIDLFPGGVTPNDLGDWDSGPNELQNYPELRSVTYLGGKTVIVGSLNSLPNTNYKLQFYENEECDPSGYGEGKKFLGMIERATDPSGNIGTFAFQVGSLIPEGRFVTTTATDPLGSTSEFSKCIKVTTSREDTDGDGVGDRIEDLAPNGGDGNGDGIPDREQAHVVSFLSVNGKMVTLAVTGSCKEAHWTGTSSVSDDPQFDYPFGVMKFRISCKSARIEIIFHEADDLTGYVFRKYGPVVPGKEGTKKWYTFPAGVSGKRVVFYLGDNRLGDDTGKDGAIVFMGGPARHRRNTKASLGPER